MKSRDRQASKPSIRMLLSKNTLHLPQHEGRRRRARSPLRLLCQQAPQQTFFFLGLFPGQDVDVPPFVCEQEGCSWVLNDRRATFINNAQTYKNEHDRYYHPHKAPQPIKMSRAGSVAQWMGAKQKSLMHAKDRRVEINSEVLSNMKIIKIQGWEETFQDHIPWLRKMELQQLLQYFIGMSLSRMLWTFTPLLVALATQWLLRQITTKTWQRW